MRKYSFQFAPSYTAPSVSVSFWDEFVENVQKTLDSQVDLRALIFKRAEVRYARRRPSAYRL